MKTINLTSPPFRHARQSGAALITGLIFLVVLTMIGLTAARMSSLEERMSGNMRDRSLAMQAAELALRDAEKDITGSGTGPRNPAIWAMTGFWPTCNQDGINGTADDGLCDRKGGTPAFTSTAMSWPQFTSAAGTVYTATTVNLTAAPSVEYGTFTEAPTITGLSAQPRYLIEGISVLHSGESSVSTYYRITARAQGANTNTVVWLQEIFKP